MNDICVPIPRIKDARHAEVEVKIDGKKHVFNYRVESFSWSHSKKFPQDSSNAFRLNRIDNLRKSIETYDANWELIQIYNPAPADQFIQVLFREKK